MKFETPIGGTIFPVKPIYKGCNFISGYAFKGSDFVDRGCPIIKIKNIQNGIVTTKESQFVSDEVITNKLSKFKLTNGDILIAMTGQGSVGRVGKLYIDKGEEPYLNQRVGKFVTDEINLNKDYLYYVIGTKAYENYLFAAGSGSGQPNLSPSIITSLEIPFPPYEVQCSIGQILKKLDDKIELNRQTNQTLEQIAQTLFKSWFVDFDPVKAKIAAKQDGGNAEQIERAAMAAISGKTESELDQLTPEQYTNLKTTAALFPDKLVDSELGEVPEDWKVTTFGEVSNCFDSKRIPLSKKQREQKKPGNIPYYGATSVMDYVNEWLFDDIYLLLGEDGSVIKEDGSPFIQYIWGKSWVNNHAHVLQGKNGVSTEQLMLFMQNQNIAAYITGAVQLKLNQGNMNNIPFLDAGKTINSAFYNALQPLYAKIRSNTEQNGILTTTRDSLLPKLLSGEISIGGDL